MNTISHYKKLLVAVDLSEVSVNALNVAMDLSDKLGAKLDIVHSLPISAVTLPVNGIEMYNEELIQEELGKARRNLEFFVDKHKGNFTNLVQHVCFGEPTSEINKFAQANNADMIVIGTHGRSGLSHLLLGSVAESVLKRAKVPVVCVRNQ